MSRMAIEVKGLKKKFGEQVVLDGVELNVAAGTIYALLGPNGAGKTTLIHILSTLIAPDEGTARIEGNDVVREADRVRRSISLTGQFAAVDEVLTGEENLRMMSRLSGLSAPESRARTNELLAQFDLAAAAGKRAKTYSGGMRRRLDLAVSLVVGKPVLFLDEPTTGLDTISRRALWDIIRGLKDEGMTIFLTTQYLEEADELADVISVIDEGRIVATGTASQLKARVGGEVIELRDESDELILSLPTSGHVQDVRNALNEISHAMRPDTKINIRKPSLDDVFLAFTKSDAKASLSQPKEESVS